MALIIMRLHPVEPVEGAGFTRYLEGLRIKAFDLTFNQGSADEVPIGEAEYVAPTGDPWDPNPDTDITQHFDSTGFLPPFPQAVATAVVEVTPPAGHSEHHTSDVRLEITRDGGEILHQRVYFNVPVHVDDLPEPSEFPDLEPTSLYLPLPGPGREINPDDAFVELPEDGTPPRFEDLEGAVEKVLAGDPGTSGPSTSQLLSALTPTQAEYVAQEIVWNRKFRPLPQPREASLEDMYTGSAGGEARARFEGELRAYYSTGDAEAERLAGYVFALGAAVQAAEWSREAQRVGFVLPVLPGQAPSGTEFKSVRVLLTDQPPADLGFEVPASYFYALGATMVPQLGAEQRYRLATLAEERQVRADIEAAEAAGVIGEFALVGIPQATRRLRALGAIAGVAPEFELNSDPAVQELIQAWLAFDGDDTAEFWGGPLTQGQLDGHLRLVLEALTGGHSDLIDAITATSVSSASQLSTWTAAQWRGLFIIDHETHEINDDLLPDFTKPGSDGERLAAFVRHVQKFFAVQASGSEDPDPVLDGPPRFRELTADPLTRFVETYQAQTGAPFVFGESWDAGHAETAVGEVFPDDAEAGAWLEQVIRTIDELALLVRDQGAQPAPPAEVQFSVMEALYARGFTSRHQVAQLAVEEFREALIGTVAYEHAEVIHGRAGLTDTSGNAGGNGHFHPVNPDGCLVNCVPPPHLSPLGPVAYLHDLLQLKLTSTCDDPAPDDDEPTLGDLLAERRGDLAALAVTPTNLDTPLPLIDLTNECLEAVAADPASPAGAVHDTNGTELGGHSLDQHEPATLFAALPEHSTPATPIAEPDAYTALRTDFSAPSLPYGQPLDVNRTYLRHLRSTRFAVMRRFRRDITELVLDPASEPGEFQRHLWRYPVRIEVAREYLGITPDEHELLYTRDIAVEPADDRLLLRELYGFPAETIGDIPWTDLIARLSEFLQRTGLSYCEFRQLWQSGFVPMTRVGDQTGFPECEPCYLDDYHIDFGQQPIDALRRLAVFIRLWRTLQTLPTGGYTFAELRDICEVLRLFDADGSINPDFVRQLAAFQLLRADFGLALTDGTAPAAGTHGAERTHLLALWVGDDAPQWAWALDDLLDQVQHYAKARHRCGTRPPEFVKLLAENLDPLSVLAGFNPSKPADTWHAWPTHTLRFAELLAKLYASDFRIGEVLFLFTASDHLAGDDPFPMQPPNEALESPLDLPDDETRYSLAQLRRTLLDVDVSEQDAAQWSWTHIDTTLRTEFGFRTPAGGPDPLLALGQHYFPLILASEGYLVARNLRQYRTSLSGTSAPMWNTPPHGPFRYDPAAGELFTELPLTDEAVIAKLSRIRQLSGDESRAVRELYFAPRADLAPFAFLFPDFAAAEERLIQEPDEDRRWHYFQQAFATCYARSKLIAEHLAGHVTAWTGRDHGEGSKLAWRLLAHLLADENGSNDPWERDSGQPPEVTWPQQPTAGGFAALLGLLGTGLLGEFSSTDTTVWREVRGPLTAFGEEENAGNAPIPTVLPAIGVATTPAQQRFVSIRNGFAIANSDGTFLGGAQGFTTRWSGALLVDTAGEYTFFAGAATPEDEAPDFAAAAGKRWRVRLSRGQRTWVLLSHQWPDETAPADRSGPLTLQPGAYDLSVEFTQPEPSYTRAEDVCPVTGGLQVKYAGPDSCDRIVSLPRERLFRDEKRQTLAEAIDGLDGTAQQFLAGHYTSSLRDIRRTYQRAFRALLFAHRHALSARPVADDGQSEIGYMLAHPEKFAGFSYYRRRGGFRVHRAFFDANLLPVGDNYHSWPPGRDQRTDPSLRRQQALFDWWERTFDYTTMRQAAQLAPERPVWLLFHEAAENHPDDPAHLLRHMGVDLLHAPLVSRYDPGYQLTSVDLEDDRWAVRVWHADRWLDALRAAFLERDIREARPDLWASDVPDNANLTGFVRAGCVDNGEPRRYRDIQRLNDRLRERGRGALLSHLCGMNRVALPSGEVVTEPKQLSELLLLDVEAGLCQRASRIEDAITAVQAFVQRARLGLEPGFVVPAAFALLWDRRFASHAVWAACTRRDLYRENWIDWDELEHAQRSEAFRLLQTQLRRNALAVPVPGGLEHWPDRRPPHHPGLQPVQGREPAELQRTDPAGHGFDLLGTRERHARPSWLAALGLAPEQPDEPEDPIDPEINIVVDADTEQHRLPLWIQAAIRLGARFVRVAAAAEPPASTSFTPRRSDPPPACCEECGEPHPATVDEYYFWLLDAERYAAQTQNAEWSWHDPEELPKRLHWEGTPAVHLAWCRVHNGEFTQPRRAHEAVRTVDAPELRFHGRTGDSLFFAVDGGDPPKGHHDPAPAGFRYDLATDAAVTLPLVVAPPQPVADHPGGLVAYPYFAYHAPGAPLFPTSAFAPALAVAAHLRAHCRFEDALKWYELDFAPLQSDSAWLRCAENEPSEPEPDPEPVPTPELVHRSDGRCCHDGAAASQEHARQRSVVLHYLETLLDWGDALMRRNTPEAFAHARLIYDTMTRLLGSRPRTVLAAVPEEPPPTLGGFVAHHAPLNPRLLSLYEHAAGRLDHVHACLNSNGLRPDQQPYGGTHETPRGQVCLDEAEWCAPHSPYRFEFLIAQAQQLAGEARGLGAALLAAYEKGDAEYLTSLRATHDGQLLHLTREVRQHQWRESDWQLQALHKTREIVQTRHRYYTQLIQNGLSNKEAEHETLTQDSLSLQGAANDLEAIAQGMHVVPDFLAGFTNSLTWIAVGTKLSGFFSAGARISSGRANVAAAIGGLRLTQAGFERREDEWRHQVEVLGIELEQIERQILAAERRRDVALRELNTHQRQIEQSREIHDFQRDRFTSHQLYLFLQQETAALHAQTYELALHAARQAQRAFNYERGHTAHTFVSGENWDDLREGLLSGERLQLELRRMEQAYLDANTREYELTKHLSLRLHFPMQFLELQATGACEIDVPEWLFDLDYPGHYLRRTRNVSLTIPCVVGPYTTVHCRLTLLSSTTRTQSGLSDAPHACCPDGQPGNGYEALPDDPRIVSHYAATEAIATSGGQNDAGMFELSFRDERYLPFEFAGAVSRWRIELPPENNQFDVDTVTDVVMHLNYTAREGGEQLRRAANEIAQRHQSGANLRYFDVRYDMPEAWHAFRSASPSVAGYRELPLRLSRAMFPFLRGRRDLAVGQMVVFFEVAGAVPSAHTVVEFRETPLPDAGNGQQQCRPRQIRCVASADWPGLYQGVLDGTDLRVSRDERELGLFSVPAELGTVTRVFLFCHYQAADEPTARGMPVEGRRPARAGLAPQMGASTRAPLASPDGVADGQAYIRSL